MKEAEVLEGLKVQVDQAIYTAKDIILATGTKPFVPPIEGLTKAHFEIADTFFDMEQLPKQLVIIGGGVIASEIASSMADLDVDVTILEKGDSILSSEIKEIRDHLSTYLKQQGVNIITNSETKKCKDFGNWWKRWSLRKYHTRHYSLRQDDNLMFM